MTTINSTYKTMAQDLWATKERTSHYEIRSISNCCQADGWYNLKYFSYETYTRLPVHYLEDKVLAINSL